MSTATKKKKKAIAPKPSNTAGVPSTGRGVFQPGMHLPENVKGWQKKICICVPVTGNVRVEWMMARFGQVIPVNWSNGDIFQPFDMYSPLGYGVADARNYCVNYSITQGFEWTFFIDHDVLLPPDTFLKIARYMREKKHPVVSGLYFCKGSEPEPLIFRGRGNSFFPADKWRVGDLVWVDGIPMGTALIHNSILELMWHESPQYTLPTTAGGQVVRRVFETPRKCTFDPEKQTYQSLTGTEDLHWCDRVMEQKYLERAGWKKHQKMKYPFLMDTSIFGQHIDPNGIQYPANKGIVHRPNPNFKPREIK